jgi:hypothetical protein
MPVPARSFTPEQLADAYRSHVETDEPHASIAKRLGISERTLGRLICREGWPRRRQTVRRNMLQPAPSSSAPMQPPLIPEDEAARADIEMTAHRAVEAIRLMVARLPKGRNVSAVERIARALATLIRTLQEVTRLRAMQTAHDAPEPQDDRGPAEPDEFARELLRRFEAFTAREPPAVPDEPATGAA